MISFADLKKIEQSSYADQFRSGILALANRLLWLGQERSLSDANSLGALSDDKLKALEEFQKSLRKLVNGEDAEKQDALNKLKEFPAFLSQKAFADQVNSPSMLQRLVEAEQNSFQFQEKKLREDLYYVSGVLELGLDLGLSRQEQEEMSKAKRLTREMWAKPVQPELPKRGEAERGSWAALFYGLTKPSDREIHIPDAPVYEYKCSDNTMLRLAAAREMLAGKSNDPVPRKQTLKNRITALRNDPIAALTLRNKYSVELLRRGNLIDITNRVNATNQQFSFENRQQLEDAQIRVRHILKQMNEMREGKTANSQEFTNLKQCLNEFTMVDWNTPKLQDYSANVLIAVENFTKGRKKLQRTQRARDCVNLALDALTAAVPNAVVNPHVTPLIARFNELRGPEDRINLARFGAFRTNTAESMLKKITEPDELQSAVVAGMGRLHNQKIDPALCFRTIQILKVYKDGGMRNLRSKIRVEADNGGVSAVALAETLAQNPARIHAVKNMTDLQLNKAIEENEKNLVSERWVKL